MREFFNEDDGLNYITTDVLSVNDYGGAGDIGEANIRALKRDQPDAWEMHDHYGRSLWLVDNEDNREIIHGLENNYPLYDEEEQSNVMDEWEREAWDNWLREDLLKRSGMPDDLAEYAIDIPDEELWEMYRNAMEQTNTYAVAEDSGVHVDVKRVAPAFHSQIENHLFLNTPPEEPDWRPTEMTGEDYYA